VALGALTVRALAAAYPTRDPSHAEGVVLVDDLEVEQDARAQQALPGLLRRALPRVQWIVTTASPAVTVGCEVNEVLALRRMPGAREVELHQGDAAVMH
jgi:predicted ATP-binding protein involved in virulence